MPLLQLILDHARLGLQDHELEMEKEWLTILISEPASCLKFLDQGLVCITAYEYFAVSYIMKFSKLLPIGYRWLLLFRLISIKEFLTWTSKYDLIFFLFFFYFLLLCFFFLLNLKTLFDHFIVLLSYLLSDFYFVFLSFILLLIIFCRLQSSLLCQIFEIFLIPNFYSLGSKCFCLVFRCFVDGFESFWFDRWSIILIWCG